MSRTIDALHGLLHERARTHGPAKDVFDRAARLWSVYLGRTIEPEEVAHLLLLLKLARSREGAHNHDDFLDAAGYAVLAADLAE